MGMDVIPPLVTPMLGPQPIRRPQPTDFVVVSTPHFNCQFLFLGQFAEATKISILSNDQTCHLCNVGPIVFFKFGKNLFSEDI